MSPKSNSLRTDDFFDTSVATGEVKLWDAMTNDLIQTFERAGSGIVTFSRDADLLLAGPSVISVADDPFVTLSEIRSGGEDALFSPDGRWIVSADRSFGVHVFTVSDGAYLGAARPHETAVWSLGMAPFGNLFASGSQTARLWGLPSRELLHVVDPKILLGVNAVAFSDNGQFLATGSNPGGPDSRTPPRDVPGREAALEIWAVGGLTGETGDQPVSRPRLRILRIEGLPVLTVGRLEPGTRYLLLRSEDLRLTPTPVATFEGTSSDFEYPLEIPGFYQVEIAESVDPQP